MNLEMLIWDLLARMKERGIRAEATYTFDSHGNIISFKIDILGYND